MRATCIWMLSILILSVGLCAFSLLLIEHVTGEMEEMRLEVLKCVEQGDLSEAGIQLAQVAEMWKRHEPVLEILVPHEMLHEINIQLIEANANLEAGDLSDFSRSIALLGEMIRHLYTEEMLKLTNIL